MGSERYVYITDNTGSINYQAMTADFALQLGKTNQDSFRPSVVYLKKMGVDSGGPYYIYRVRVQVSMNNQKYIYLYYSDGSYQLYAEGKYCDNETTDIDRGYK